MKIQFKVQPYQTAAVEAVLECFAGQPYQDAFSYKIDPGASEQEHSYQYRIPDSSSAEHGFRNQPILLSANELLKNIQNTQKQQNLFQSNGLENFTNISGKALPASYKP